MDVQSHDAPRTVKPPDEVHAVEAVCEALARVLGSGVDVHRCLAAKALGRIGHPSAVPPLIDALLDEDPDLRSDAAAALSRLSDDRAAKPLFESLLGDPCVEVKLAALEGLVGLRQRDVVPWLRRLVAGRDPEIVWDEASYFQDGWDDWTDLQLGAIKGLAALGAAEALPDILSALADEEGQDVSEVAFKALARLGEAGTEALGRQLDETDPRRRRRAAAALASSGQSAAAAALERALRDPAAEVRLAAFAPLAAADPADARLATFLDDPDPRLRAEAARSIGARHPERLAALADDEDPAVSQAALGVAARDEDIDALAAALGDPQRPMEARLVALRALRRAGGGPATSALVQAVGDRRRSIRLEALAALAAIADADESWPNAADEALLSALGGALVPAPERPPESEPTSAPAAATIQDRDTEATAEATPTSTLAAIVEGEPHAAAALDAPEPGEALTPDDIERLAVARRTPRRRTLPVDPPVAPHTDVPVLAARVLGDLPRVPVALALAEALTHDDRDLRLAAADSLARIGEHIDPLPDAVSEALRTALPEAERDCRLAIVRALAASDGERTAPLLLDCLRDGDSFVRAEAVRALARLGRTGTETQALLGDPDPGVRLAAAAAVAGAGRDGAVDLLVDFAFSFEGYHRREAARLLRRLDRAGATARFLEALDDRDRLRARPVAIEALEELNASEGS